MSEGPFPLDVQNQKQGRIGNLTQIPSLNNIPRGNIVKYFQGRTITPSSIEIFIRERLGPTVSTEELERSKYPPAKLVVLESRPL